jgi:hypothetical protein
MTLLIVSPQRVCHSEHTGRRKWRGRTILLFAAVDLLNISGRTDCQMSPELSFDKENAAGVERQEWYQIRRGKGGEAVNCDTKEKTGLSPGGCGCKSGCTWANNVCATTTNSCVNSAMAPTTVSTPMY